MNQDLTNAELDVALDAWRTVPPDADLIARIVATGPAPRPVRAGWLGWLAPLSLGAGLAAACGAGLMVGTQVSRNTLEHNESVVAALDPTTVGEGV